MVIYGNYFSSHERALPDNEVDAFLGADNDEVVVIEGQNYLSMVYIMKYIFRRGRWI